MLGLVRPISTITTIPPGSFSLPPKLMQRVPNQAGGSAEFSHKFIHGNRHWLRVTQVPPVLNPQVERATPKCTIRFLHRTLLSCIALYLLNVSPHRYLSPLALVVVIPFISTLIFSTRRTGKRFLIITLRAGHFRRYIDASGRALGHLKPSQCLASRCINVSVCMPGEIIAKKMWHRGNSVTARDLFDLALVIERESKALQTAAQFIVRFRDSFLEQIKSRHKILSMQFNEIDAWKYQPTFLDWASAAERFLRRLGD